MSGEVLRWNSKHGTQTVPAPEYIRNLEAEIRGLKQQASAALRYPERLSQTYTMGGSWVAVHGGASQADALHLDLQVASVRVGPSNQNELLEYIQSLGSDAELLTAHASQDVLDAMTAFVDRCMGKSGCTEGGYARTLDCTCC